MNREKHGKSYSRLYRIWAGIKTRCLNPTDSNYIKYGGRGIKVCEEWIENFNSFEKWALENGYIDGLTIDRINVNGNYEPGNCRWATVKIQNNNRRDNHYLTYNGKTQTIQMWAEEFGINHSVVRERINKLGWSVEDALTKPCVWQKKNN